MQRHPGSQEAINQSGKCFIVTGANTGIGLEISRVLATRGARVLLGCRDKAKAEAAMAKIRSLTPEADLAFLSLDQADLESIRAAAALAAKEPRIDGLINNAGVMNTPLMRTKQGFELQFGVNHLGTFALTALLLPKLSESKGARVVVTSSLAHRNARIDWDDLNAEKSYSPFKRYAPSKLANALFFFELNRRLRALGSPVTAVGCHPGMAATDLALHGSAPDLKPDRQRGPQQRRQRCMARAAGRDRKRHAGGYYGPIGLGGVRGVSGEASRAPQATDPALARRLWDVSIAMTGVDPGLPPMS